MIAKILDGQHRIEGRKGYEGDDFQLNVTIFVNADIADQANIFATVNLAQTKVNKSLVYDLYDYAHSSSPQKTAHDVVVALDKHEKSPLYKMIKRLGFATEGRKDETLTQATLVEGLLNLFLTPNAQKDRDLLLKGKRPTKVTSAELRTYPFRNLFIEGKDVEVTKILLHYFSAVRDRWPEAWASPEKGNILPRTNGVRALLRFLKPAYLSVVKNEIGATVSIEQFQSVFHKVSLEDEDFSVENFPPGTSGESKLVRRLLEDTKLDDRQSSQPELI
jgi:DGQHR domain-containing protein